MTIKITILNRMVDIGCWSLVNKGRKVSFKWCLNYWSAVPVEFNNCGSGTALGTRMTKMKTESGVEGQDLGKCIREGRSHESSAQGAVCEESFGSSSIARLKFWETQKRRNLLCRERKGKPCSRGRGVSQGGVISNGLFKRNRIQAGGCLADRGPTHEKPQRYGSSPVGDLGQNKEGVWSSGQSYHCHLLENCHNRAHLWFSLNAKSAPGLCTVYPVQQDKQRPGYVSVLNINAELRLGCVLRKDVEGASTLRGWLEPASGRKSHHHSCSLSIWAVCLSLVTASRPWEGSLHFSRAGTALFSFHLDQTAFPKPSGSLFTRKQKHISYWSTARRKVPEIGSSFCLSQALQHHHAVHEIPTSQRISQITGLRIRFTGEEGIRFVAIKNSPSGGSPLPRMLFLVPFLDSTVTPLVFGGRLWHVTQRCWHSSFPSRKIKPRTKKQAHAHPVVLLLLFLMGIS